ncbi:MAG: helix-turn-helix transcriptional regulator [Chlorobi bacterium]|nr:helix-turn-helix transcriptional regulator [Chlorobiota bacterium]
MSFFGKNIRKIRIAKKMTQTEFAELFELKRTAVGAYEEGRAEAKIDTIIKIADYFKLSLDQLLRKELTINEIFHFKDDLIG